MSVKKAFFGKMPDGRDVNSYTVENRSGSKITFLELGGIISSLYLPDKNGKYDDVVCGFDSVDGYLNGGGYQGALIGRYANRINGGRFTLCGKEYTLFNNENGDTHLHGGKVGYNERLWKAEPFENGVVFELESPDMDEGYPGNLKIKVTYIFGDDNSLSITYEAVCDSDTVFNPTSHAYYNLGGYGGGKVTEQYLTIDSDRYDAIDDKMIPVGSPAPVEGTPFDFRELRKIEQGYDHNFILRKSSEDTAKAFLWDKDSGRTLTLYTDMPALQLYTGCSMDGDVAFKSGVPQRPLHALCLETQFPPDSPNREEFSELCHLRAGEKFVSRTRYVFGIKQ